MFICVHPCPQMEIPILSSYPHIYSHINVVVIFSAFSAPFGVPTPSQHFQSPLLSPAVHDQPDCIATHIGAKLLHIGDAKGAVHSRGRCQYIQHISLAGPFHGFHVQFPVL